MDFNKLVTNALKRAGRNKKWLAEQLGISAGTLSRYFTNPTLDTIRRIDSVLPLPEAAALLHSGERLSKYVGNENTNPEILARLEYLTLAYSDVLEDPEARAEFAELVQAISQLTPEQRRGLLLLLQTFDMRTK